MTEILVDQPADGTVNMGRDREIWADTESGRSQIRLYSWSGAWISLGANQARIDSGLPQVVRPTGGRAVLHGDDVTIAWALPLDKLSLSPIQIRRIYAAMMEPIVTAVNACGLPVEIGSESSDLGPKIDCFQAASRFDLCVGLAKVGGAALATSRLGALLQISILIRNAAAIGPFQARSVPEWHADRLPNELADALRQCQF